MAGTFENERSLVLSYLVLRKAVGMLGVAFPFVLALGAMTFFQTGLQSSLSSYYHTGMRDVFVGTLCAIGVFLLSYKGHHRSDDIAGNLACLFAIGVALFPIAPDDEVIRSVILIGYVHQAFAALFFLTLIYFSLFLFTKRERSEAPSKRKRQRNKVYIACGCTMLICIVLIALNKYPQPGIPTLPEKHQPVFWLETVTVLAFGISWCTKGQAILKDQV
ncbi:MAG: DUF998 domain-containing protein [Planctomycetes bacterium]|nr:DUF998 domain-containing protein [Planctomycetota bacterium]